MIKGIDISQWQGAVDFSKVKTVCDFVVIKATEGSTFIDPKFSANQSGTRSSGMLLGYYCYTRPDLGNTVESEVDFLLRTIGDLKAGEVIFLDYEVSYAKPVAWCKAWLDYLSKKLGGYKGLVYLNQSLLNGNDWSGVISAGYGLWLAVYDYNTNSPMPQTKWGLMAFRQYSNREVITGISAAVDGNVFYGDRTAYKKYGYNLVTIPETPPITPPSSEEIIAGLERKLQESTDQLIEATQTLSRITTDYKNYQDRTVLEISQKNTQIESMQKTNADLTSQLSIMSKQVEDATKERKIAVDAVQPLKDANKKLMEEEAILQKELDRLNAKLLKKLKGYSKSELFRAYFGKYPDKY